MSRLLGLVSELREALLSEKIRWKGNKAEGKHTRATIKKERFGWEVTVETNFPLPRGSYPTLDSDGTIYKNEAKDSAEEKMAHWDQEIERAGREKWAASW